MASSFATGLAEGVTSGLTGMPSGSSSKSSGKDWKRKQKMSNSKAPADEVASTSISASSVTRCTGRHTPVDVSFCGQQ